MDIVGSAGAASGDDLKAMYRHRFDDVDRERIAAFWRLLYPRFLAEYVPRNGTVVDLAAGSCDFINLVPDTNRRIAIDLNPDVKAAVVPGVEVHMTSSDDLGVIEDATVDLVFTSNFFEHLRSPEQLLATLREVRRILRPGGRIVVLMPNLRAVGARYYDYLDHSLPVTDRSLVEALGLCNLKATKVLPRFLPYGSNPAGRQVTGPGPRLLSWTQSPKVHETLIKGYLGTPIMWRFLGGQMFVVAEAV